MLRARKQRLASFLLAACLGGFWLLPRWHVWAVSCGECSGGACAAQACHSAPVDSAEASESEHAHDPEECPICRLAALPYLDSCVRRHEFLLLPPLRGRLTVPRRVPCPAYYEGFSFGARAPPA